MTAMRFPTVEELNAHFNARRMSARRRKEKAADIERERVEAMRRRLDNETGMRRIQQIRERLR